MEGKRNFGKKGWFLFSLVFGMGIVGILGSGGGGGGAGGGGNKILAKGGFNSYTGGGYGGSGGSVYINNGIKGYGGGGALTVKKSGSANASFTFQYSEADAELGLNPVEVTTDTTFTLLSSVNEPEPAPAETPYLVSGMCCNLYISTTPGELPGERLAATGLLVANGVTLTLPINGEGAGLTFFGDVLNRGTITTVNRDPLALVANAYVGSAGSSVDTSGQSNGQSGGSIYMDLNAFVNRGQFNSSGADSISSTGGSGGVIRIFGNDTEFVSAFENSGTFDASGGDTSGSYVSAGSAGSIYISASDEYFHNSGDLIARGGKGTGNVTSGGAGGAVQIEAILSAGIRNSGDIDTSGGDSTEGTAGLNAIAGGVDIYVEGGSLASSGSITARGGSNTQGNGGSGAGVSVQIWTGNCESDAVKCRPGDLDLSGAIDVSGGAATGSAVSAGNGGTVSVGIDTSASSKGQKVTLYGYAGIDMSGGAGTHPGAGGEASIGSRFGSYSGNVVPAGAIVNQADITARGGDQPPVNYYYDILGNNGGSVSLSISGCNGGDCYTVDTETITNSGDIDTSGGDSAGDSTVGGAASNISLYAYNGITNSGSLTANGGERLATALGFEDYGGAAGNIYVNAAEGAIVNSGAISAEGGDGDGGGSGGYLWIGAAEGRVVSVTNNGTLSVAGGAGRAAYYPGGGAGTIDVSGDSVTNHGSVSADGGDAPAEELGTTGGNGGSITVDSYGDGKDSTNSGTLSSDGGTGVTPGIDGCIQVDGLPISGCV